MSGEGQGAPFNPGCPRGWFHSPDHLQVDMGPMNRTPARGVPQPHAVTVEAGRSPQPDDTHHEDGGDDRAPSCEEREADEEAGAETSRPHAAATGGRGGLWGLLET